jgi:hypothetical protein
MKQYLPILKSKRGEFKSLNALPHFNKKQMIPCIELLEGTVEQTYNQLTEIWAFEGNKIIIDSSYFYTNSESAIKYIDLLERLRISDVNTIPVIEVDSSRYLIDLVNGYVLKYDGELCIRIRREFLYGSSSRAQYDALVKSIPVKIQNIILLLDTEIATVASLKENITDLQFFINGIKDPGKYALIALASGSFPENLSKIEAGTIKSLPRVEWSVWKDIESKYQLANLAYSDYGIKHPLVDPASTPFEGTCSIKYTTENHYVIFRGIRGSDHPEGGAQYHEKCKQVIAHPLYDGNIFSWADKEIDECANRINKPGNAESWVKIGHNHHFAKILSLL